MPLSEDEQRILKEIEANLSATDPDLVQQVSETTLYRHAARMIKWSVLGLIAGLVVLLLTFTKNTWLAGTGFVAMLFFLLVIERNVRKMGKAGLQSLTNSIGGGALKNVFGNFGRRWRERWRRDDQS